MSDKQQKYRAPALDKGLDILEFLARQEEPQTIAGITRAVGKTRNEIYRMLMVLEERGYLVRSDDGDGLRVSNKLFELGIQNPPLANLHDAALPVMHELAEYLFQSVHLAVQSQDQIVCVARVESPGELGFSVRVGYRRPLIKSTSGVILYAFAEDASRERWAREIEETAKSKSELKEFFNHARRAREDGFLTMPSGFVEGIQDIAAPVFGPSLVGPIASLTLPFVSGRSARTTLDEAASEVRDAAKRISDSLRGATSIDTPRASGDGVT